MLISIVCPYYQRDPQAPVARDGLACWLAGLREQPGPIEIVLAATSDQVIDPFPEIVGALAGPDYPHALRHLHATFDPRRQRPQSRAAATATGLAAATGQVLVILHADCQLPAGAADEIRVAVAAGYRTGAFRKRYEPEPWSLRVQAAWLNGWRLGTRGHSVGTNAVWLDRGLADEWPTPDWRLLEDVHLSDWLRRQVGRHGLWVSRRQVRVAAEKYLTTGLAASLAINTAVMLLFRVCRCHPDALRDELYDRRRLQPGQPGFWCRLARVVVELWRGGRRLPRGA